MSTERPRRTIGTARPGELGKRIGEDDWSPAACHFDRRSAGSLEWHLGEMLAHGPRPLAWLSRALRRPATEVAAMLRRMRDRGQVQLNEQGWGLA